MLLPEDQKTLSAALYRNVLKLFKQTQKRGGYPWAAGSAAHFHVR
jgi:hypothetical protein